MISTANSPAGSDNENGDSMLPLTTQDGHQEQTENEDDGDDEDEHQQGKHPPRKRFCPGCKQDKKAHSTPQENCRAPGQHPTFALFRTQHHLRRSKQKPQQQTFPTMASRTTVTHPPPSSSILQPDRLIGHTPNQNLDHLLSAISHPSAPPQQTVQTVDSPSPPTSLAALFCQQEQRGAELFFDRQNVLIMAKVSRSVLLILSLNYDPQKMNK